jgi:hypothetical protein
MKIILSLLFAITFIGFIFADNNINKSECELCDLIVYRINILIKNNKSDEIPDMLTNLCFRTNLHYRSICEMISDKYLKIIELLENKTNRNFVCDKLNLCNIIDIENNKIDEDNLICEIIFFSLKNNFNILKHSDIFDKFIEQTCKKMPTLLIPRCENMYVSYIEYFKNSIENKRSSLETCLDIYYSINFDKKLEENIDYETLHEL